MGAEHAATLGGEGGLVSLAVVMGAEHAATLGGEGGVSQPSGGYGS